MEATELLIKSTSSSVNIFICSHLNLLISGFCTETIFTELRGHKRIIFIEKDLKETFD